MNHKAARPKSKVKYDRSNERFCLSSFLDGDLANVTFILFNKSHFMELVIILILERGRVVVYKDESFPCRRTCNV